MMKSIRRYGPSLVSPEVSPSPQLGRGAEMRAEAFQEILGSAQRFIRPAVVEHRTRVGQKEALDELQDSGPEWELRQRDTGSTTVTMGGEAGEDATSGRMRIGPTRVRAALQSAGQKHGVDPGILGTIAFLESSFDPSAKNPDSTAGGLFQFLDGTAADYGLENKFDLEQSADAGARLTRDGINYLSEKLGREPSVGEIYLAHQQGMGGAVKLLSAPPTQLASSVVGRDAVALNGGDPDSMTASEFAGLWVNKANKEAKRHGISSTSVTIPNAPEYELEAVNQNTFEPRLPFTVRDAAFNKAADRVLASRAGAALEEGMRAAQQRADGDLGKLSEEMEKVRAEVMGNLPKEMPSLQIDLQSAFDRGKLVAERQAVELSQRRVFQRQEEAINTVVSTTKQEAERLALTGATAEELSSYMSDATATLAQFGPREGFTFNGTEFPADPTRAGILSADAIAQNMASITMGARRLMLEAEFEKSQAPGQFVDEFRRQVFSGNAPLPPGESLDMLRTLESRAASAESARRSASNRERDRLEKGMDATINAYVSMTEAGVPVAIPEEERQAILKALSPHPDLQRKARQEFAVADAQVQTHGMSGPDLMDYVEKVRADMVDSMARGELDLDGAAVIESLEDRIKKVQDAITAETIGLPMIEQLAKDGATADQVNYDALREQAAGKPDLLDAVNEVEAFHRDIENLQGMSASQRSAVLEDARGALATLAAEGEGYGSAALASSRVLDRLEEWSDHRQKLAKNDPVKFAAASGVQLASMAEAENMGDVGNVIASRVEAIAPLSMSEGVNNPVPLSQAELDQVSELFANSSRGEKSAFLGSVAALGEDRAMAVFNRVGQAEPTLFAAGAVYTMGNQAAAGVILRGATDAKLEGGTTTDIAAAREAVVGPLFEADLLGPDDPARLDATALAYARGVAMSEGGRPIELDDLEAGYKVALGRQQDGTGGLADTDYGPTVVPAGWDAGRLEDAIDGIDDEKLIGIARGMVVDRNGRPMDARQFTRSIEGLRPAEAMPWQAMALVKAKYPDLDIDENVLFPIDPDGGMFLGETGGGVRAPIFFDLRDFD